jgi:hypothetical protein
MNVVAAAEKISWAPKTPEGFTPPDRKWILDAYSECVEAVKGTRKRR